MSRISVVLPLLLPEPFLATMTEFCLKALALNASGTNEVELVIVETGSDYFAGWMPGLKIQDPVKYLRFERGPDRNYVKDWNAGADAATGSFLVHIGNDVIVGKDWDVALMEPFQKYRDCGVTCTSALEFGSAPVGQAEPLPGVVVEGMYAPLMCFRKGWKFDEAYEGGYSDSDLIMRIYSEGLRAYRSYSSVCWHFGPMTTWKRAETDGGWGQVYRGEETFYERWSESPLMMYAMIRAGQVRYGQEHLARCARTPPEEKAAKRA